MNKNINLVEILKDCPKGTKFYSAIHGEIHLTGIYPNSIYPIRCYRESYGEMSFTEDGRVYRIEDSECVIFPSKDQRDWNIWCENNIKEKAKKVFQSFNDGDYIHFDDNDDAEGWTVIYRKTNELEVRGYACRTNNYTSIMGCVGHVGTKPDAYNVRLATPKEIEQLDNALAKLKKRWNPTTKEFEDIKTEMTISEIEKKLGLTSGSLRIKK